MSTQKTGSSKTSDGNDTIFYSSKVKFYDLMLKLSETNNLMKNYVCVFLEVIFFVQLLIYSLQRCFDFDEFGSTITKFVLVFNNPTLPKSTFIVEYYIAISLIACLICVLYVFLFLYLYFSQEGSGMIFTSFAFLSRLMRTLLFFPVLNTLLSTLECDIFNGSLMSHLSEGQRCTDFPFFIFLICNPFCIVVFVLACSIDSLFILDKLKSIKMITASPNGRFTCLFLLNCAVCLIVDTFCNKVNGLSFIGGIYGTTSNFILLLLYFRLLPYFNVIFSLTTMVVISTNLSIYCTSVVNDFLRSYWGFIALASFFVFVPISILIFVGRFWIIFKFFSKGLKFNLLFCYYAQDMAIIIHLTKKKKEQIRNFVSSLIKNLKFKKTKSICDAFISLIIDDRSNILLSHGILKYAESDFEITFPDVEFCLYFYKNKINEIQNAKESSLSKVVKDLNRTRKIEEKLRLMYLQFFSSLSSENVKIDSRLLELISQIYFNKRICSNNYRRMIKILPSKTIFRAYANFLVTFCNDKKNAEVYLNEATVFEGRSTASVNSIKSTDDIEMKSNETSTTTTTTTTTTKVENINIVEDNTDNESTASAEMDMDIFNPNFDNRSLKSASVKGSVFSLGSGMSQRKTLQKRLTNNRDFSVWTLVISLFFLFVAGVACIIFTFVLATTLVSSFSSSEVIIENAARISFDSVGVAHFFRKLQISQYPFPKTIFDHERNTSSFRERTEACCENMLEKVQLLYKYAPDLAWRNEIVSLVEKIDGNPFMASYESYVYGNYSLLDGIMTYYAKCKRLLELPDSAYGNRTKGFRLEDNDDFVFVTLNEPPLHVGLEKLLNQLIVVESGRSSTMRILFIIIPFIILSAMGMIVIPYCFVNMSLKKSIKGLRLIAKEQSMALYEKFGGNNNAGASQTHWRSISGMSNTNRFFLFLIFFFILTLSFVTLFCILSLIVLVQYEQRNVQYDFALRSMVGVRRVHLWTVELLYRDDTLFNTDEIVDGLKGDLLFTKDTFENLRFGNVKDNLIGIDQMAGTFDVFYTTKNKICLEKYENELIQNLDPNDESFYYKFNCLPMNQLMTFFLESAQYLLDSNYTNPIIRGDINYNNIIHMDNNHYDKGVIQEDMEQLAYEIARSTDLIIDVISNLSYILIIVGLPAFVILFFVLFYQFPNTLQGMLIEPKKLMLLLPDKVLNEKSIFSFISGKSSFQKVFKEEKLQRIDDVYNIIKNCYYPIVIFNNKLHCLKVSESFSSMFGLGNTLDRMLITNFFDEESSNSIKKWMKKKSSSNFNQELTAIFNSDAFKVTVDISRNDDSSKYFAHVENIETTKRKEILSLAEKRSEKTNKLLCNILPSVIVSQMKENEGTNFENKNITKLHPNVTAVFADIVNFTGISRKLDPKEIISFLNEVFSAIDDLTKKFGLEKIKTIGDCYFAVAGIPVYKPHHQLASMNFAISLLQFIHDYRIKHNRDIHFRVGMSSGKVVAGIIGKMKWCYDVWGDVVNIASRLEEAGIADKIQISRATYSAVYDKFDFKERKIRVQGVEKVLTVYVHTPKIVDTIVEELHADNSDEIKIKEVVKGEKKKITQKQSPIGKQNVKQKKKYNSLNLFRKGKKSNFSQVKGKTMTLKYQSSKSINSNSNGFKNKIEKSKTSRISKTNNNKDIVFDPSSF